MMITTLGPRHIHWRDTKGGSGVITILIQGLPDHVVTFEAGDVARSSAAQVHISSTWQDRVMSAIGADDLQVVFRLLQFTSVYLDQVCRDSGVELTDFVSPLNAVTEFNAFRSAAV